MCRRADAKPNHRWELAWWVVSRGGGEKGEVGKWERDRVPGARRHQLGPCRCLARGRLAIVAVHLSVDAHPRVRVFERLAPATDLRAVVLPGSPLDHMHMHFWADYPAAVYANHRRLKSLQHVLQVDSHARPCLSVSGLSAVEQPSSYSRLRAERTGKTS